MGLFGVIARECWQTPPDSLTSNQLIGLLHNSRSRQPTTKISFKCDSSQITSYNIIEMSELRDMGEESQALAPSNDLVEYQEWSNKADFEEIESIIEETKTKSGPKCSAPLRLDTEQEESLHNQSVVFIESSVEENHNMELGVLIQQDCQILSPNIRRVPTSHDMVGNRSNPKPTPNELEQPIQDFKPPIETGPWEAALGNSPHGLVDNDSTGQSSLLQLNKLSGMASSQPHYYSQLSHYAWTYSEARYESYPLPYQPKLEQPCLSRISTASHIKAEEATVPSLPPFELLLPQLEAIQTKLFEEEEQSPLSAPLKFSDLFKQIKNTNMPKKLVRIFKACLKEKMRQIKEKLRALEGTQTQQTEELNKLLELLKRSNNRLERRSDFSVGVKDLISCFCSNSQQSIENRRLMKRELGTCIFSQVLENENIPYENKFSYAKCLKIMEWRIRVSDGSLADRIQSIS